MAQLNPGAKNKVTIPTLTGRDKEDGKKVRYYILSLPEKGTLFNNGQKINKAGLEIKDPSKLTMDPRDGDVEVSFDYVTVDHAGVTSSPAKVKMPFLGLTISGYVFDDGNGDTTINGKVISNLDEKPLYVMLLNDRDMILASKAVDENGSYHFDGTDGDFS